MQKTVVLNVVGLSARLLPHLPNLNRWARQGQVTAIAPLLPAVTCSAQATYLTGTLPTQHGIVGNGWYFRDECEVKFWRQSNHLVQAPKLWDIARDLDPSFTCANLFWWYNMYSSVDYAVTPRPMYPADGRKLPDIYTQPGSLRSPLQQDLGQFPLFNFWGPNTSINATQWIADAARWIETRHSPTLTLIYLPHLDYCLQRTGTHLNAIAQDLQAIDTVCAQLIHDYEAQGAKVIVLSEYGINPVSAPIHINRMLRVNDWLKVREELGLELLDAGASQAFAVADHQIAHVYIKNPEILPKVRSLLESIPGIALVLDAETKPLYGLDHPRAGELVAIAAPESWFTYYYWLNDRKAPDFARTVDIHRKPGYDPAELCLDPALKFPQLKIATRLLQKKLGFRALLDVIPLDAHLVCGSHGSPFVAPDYHPLLITQQGEFVKSEAIAAPEVFSILLQHLRAPVPVPLSSSSRNR